MKKTLLVEGMSCGHCEKAVKDALGQLTDVRDVQVDLGQKTVLVEGDNLDNKILKDTIEDAGYDLIKID